MHENNLAVLEPRPLPDFVETEYLHKIIGRAMSYISAGFPVHLRGPSGTGKTTLALHLAELVARPIVMIQGDEEYSTRDLTGGELGYKMRKVVDNFIHSVLKVDESVRQMWVDSRLITACKRGFTLIYDEFTRSRPEANNVLLPILQEKLLGLAPNSKEGYLSVHPDFTAIFTSNPVEYAGVYRSQDALLDRMVTLDLPYPDRTTEIAITGAKSGLQREYAERIVDIVQELRRSDGRCEIPPTVRSSIMIAKTFKNKGEEPWQDDAMREVFYDVLVSGTTRGSSREAIGSLKKTVDELIDKHLKRR